MPYVIMIRRPTFPEDRNSLHTHWTEIVAVEGDKIYLNDHASYRNTPYGGDGKPVLRPAMEFANITEAERVKATWLRVYGGAYAGIRIQKAG